MIEHENTLRDQRLGWMFALNGFLFTALSFAWKTSKSLSLILAALGAAMALSSLATLHVSSYAIRMLRARAPRPDDGENVVVGLRGEVFRGKASDMERRILQPKPWDRLVPGLYTWFAAPVFLLIAWVAVFVARLRA
jgi:hypothetical protein